MPTVCACMFVCFVRVHHGGYRSCQAKYVRLKSRNRYFIISKLSVLHLQEQVEWAVQEGADFIIAETFGELAEAKLALECIKEVKKGQKRCYRGVEAVILIS